MAEITRSHSYGRHGPLSVHFDARELRCPHCGTCLVLDELVSLLESIRAHARKPLRVVSGYRCPWHNYAVGGASDSQHMYGTAADIPERFVTVQAAFKLGARGVGSRGEWAVHVDVRRGSPAHWTYGPS